MCKKQVSVSHGSTESEIISLDAGLRMDGIPALDLWDVVIGVLHSEDTTRRSTPQDPSLSTFDLPDHRQLPTAPLSFAQQATYHFSAGFL